MSNDRLTVGALRSLIDGLPDDTPIGVEWEPGEAPSDNAPAVRIFGFRGCRWAGQEYVNAMVGLAWLDELPDDEQAFDRITPVYWSVEDK